MPRLAADNAVSITTPTFFSRRNHGGMIKETINFRHIPL